MRAAPSTRAIPLTRSAVRRRDGRYYAAVPVTMHSIQFLFFLFFLFFFFFFLVFFFFFAGGLVVAGGGGDGEGGGGFVAAGGGDTASASDSSTAVSGASAGERQMGLIPLLPLFLPPVLK